MFKIKLVLKINVERDNRGGKNKSRDRLFWLKDFAIGAIRLLVIISSNDWVITVLEGIRLPFNI